MTRTEIDKKVRKELSILTDGEIFSEAVETMAKTLKDPNYYVVAKLVLGMNARTLMRMCSLFGGCEIRIPTSKELRQYIGAIYLKEKIDSGEKIEEVVQEFALEDRAEIVKIYGQIRKL